MSWGRALLAVPLYLAGAALITVILVLIAGDRAILGGYIPALSALVAYGLAIRYTAPGPARRYGRWLLVAAGVFAVSLTLRTFDAPLCGQLPFGLHFLWHCLNAVVLFTVSYAALRRWQTRRVR